MDLPKKISPCPIIEALVELRFIPKQPDEAVYGLLYSALKDYYKKFEDLPTLQIPVEIRKRDPSFAFNPLYRMLNDTYSLSIGHRVLTLGCTKEYRGWSDFSEQLKITVDAMHNIGLTDKIIRVGIRYINLFELDIYKKIKLNIAMPDGEFQAAQLHIRAEIPAGDYTNTLQISDRVEIFKDNKHLVGSIIDIDTFIDETRNSNIYQDLMRVIYDGHEEEKKLFFGLLTDEYLMTLNPEH